MRGTMRIGNALLGEIRNAQWKLFCFSQTREAASLQTNAMTNHDIREMVVTAWAMLDPADRDDLVNELAYYQRVIDGHEDGYLPSLAFTVCLHEHQENWAARCGRQRR